MDGNSAKNERSTLSELVKLLQGNCRAITRFQGGNTYYTEELQIFKEVTRNQGLVLAEKPSEINRPPDGAGNEHQVWFIEEKEIFIKATWENHFGMKVLHLKHEDPFASPVHYLERWLLHNKLFGDSVEFLGFIETATGIRLIISQPAIMGHPATEEQIHSFFLATGWKKIKIADDIAYFDENENVVISDTHRGNIIALENGFLLPIDLRVQKLAQPLVDIIHQQLDKKTT